MFEYGALFNDSFGHRMADAWAQVTGFLGDLPYYWYLVILAVLIILIRGLLKA